MAEISTTILILSLIIYTHNLSWWWILIPVIAILLEALSDRF